MNQKGQENIGLYIGIGIMVLALIFLFIGLDGFARADSIRDTTNNFCIENGFLENEPSTWLSGRCVKSDKDGTILVKYYKCDDLSEREDIFIEIGQCNFVEVLR